MNNLENAKNFFLDGLQFLANQDYCQAEINFEKSLKLAPDRISTLTNLSATKIKLGKFREGRELAVRSTKLDGKNSFGFLNIGLIDIKERRYLESILYFDAALNIDPNYLEAWLNKGLALDALKRYQEALSCFNNALEINSAYAEAWAYKGLTFDKLDLQSEALSCFNNALEINPDYAEAWAYKGLALDSGNVHDAAIECLNKAVSLNPSIDYLLGDLLFAKMKICSLDHFQEEMEKITFNVNWAKKVVQPFTLLSMVDDIALHKKCSQIYTQSNHPPISILGPLPKRSLDKKIRLGYFSPDFRNHPVSLLTAELFENHSREHFEVYGFSLHRASDDDPLRMRLKKGFDYFIDVDNQSDLEIAKLVRELNIDIAIDLACHTQHSRMGIFSNRVAPVQVNWLGYAGTSGADYFDYIIADQIVIPDSNQNFYSEKVIYLPNTFMPDDSKRLPSTKTFSREECGLPEDAFIFCSFNNGYKIHRDVISSWSTILLAAPKSVLWISENNEKFKTNLISEFDKWGINQNRIIFAKRLDSLSDHLSRLALADLFLDTHPYNAHTTALDSLKAGVPILTLIGNSFASRVAASLLTASKLPEMITTSWEQYIALAIKLAKNSGGDSILKQNLRNHQLNNPLYDSNLFITNLEKAYHLIYSNHQKNLQPDHLIIE